MSAPSMAYLLTPEQRAAHNAYMAAAVQEIVEGIRSNRAASPEFYARKQFDQWLERNRSWWGRTDAENYQLDIRDEEDVRGHTKRDWENW